MKSISTPLGRFPVSEDGERAIEHAIQTGERYCIKLENGAGEPVFLTGRVRRDSRSQADYVLDLAPRESAGEPGP